MSEQVFRSPNFFEREIELKAPPATGPVGVPAGVIGMANKGPAFVPVTVASFNEFISIFGNLDPKKFGPYAVNEFLKNRTALTYMRVLGAGANRTALDISNTTSTGRVKNAGFKLIREAVMMEQHSSSSLIIPFKRMKRMVCQCLLTTTHELKQVMFLLFVAL